MNHAFPLVAALLLLCTGCHSGSEPAPQASPEPIARVQTAPLVRRELTEQLDLYGTVVPGPEARSAPSVPFESRVLRVHVRTGQRVGTGDPLVDVEPSPEARLALEQVRTDAAAATETEAAVTARFASRLATRSDVAAAARDARAAEQRVHSLVSRGAATGLTLAAAGPSVVTAVHVTEGALVTAGDPLVDLDLREHLEVRFGVEAEDIDRVLEGTRIRVRDLGLSPRVEVEAILRAVGESVNAESRLVDTYASLPEGSGLLLGQRVAGALEIRSDLTFVVPRAALVPEPDRVVVFCVDDSDAAVSHAVRVGLENDADVEILSPDLTAGMRIVVSGAAVLEDGMRVVEAGP